jgi:hypothetical protein
MPREGFIPLSRIPRLEVHARTYLRAGALPMGRLIVHLDCHFVALIDGVIHDTFDSGGAGKRPVDGYWSFKGCEAKAPTGVAPV